jgi:hypothetical protein
MNSKRDLFVVVLGGAALIWAAFHFFGAKKEAPIEVSPAAETLPTVPTAATPAFNAAAPTPQPTPSPDGPLPLLGPQLRKIGDCLQISNSLNDDADLTFRSLEDSLRGELGDLIANDTDWKNVHITMPNGEKRRLRIEVEATGEESSGLVLKYYGVDKEDLPVPIPLTDEQSKHPTDEYIASIENQGKVTLREEGRRGIFSKGAELYYTERNGNLSELEISYEGKSVKCQDLQSSHGTCNCF